MIFAESVGSCVDIIATVVKPLLAMRRPDLGPPASFTVFTDVRLLRRRLLGLPMPFVDNVVYVFDKQIEEAGLLVVNEQDLLPAGIVPELLDLVKDRFPGKRVRFQDSLSEEELWDGLRRWYRARALHRSRFSILITRAMVRGSNACLAR